MQNAQIQPTSVVLSMDEYEHLKKSLEDIKKNLAEMAIYTAKSGVEQSHVADSLSRAYDEIKEIRKKQVSQDSEINKIKQELARNSWVNRIFYTVVSAGLVGMAAATVKVIVG